MFQYVHFSKKNYKEADLIFDGVPDTDYGLVAASDWQEHCLECSAPLCFGNCLYYSKRFDNSCRSLEYGIFTKKVDGNIYRVFKFRPWGKLETFIFPAVYSKKKERRIDGLNRRLSAPVRLLMRLLSPLPKDYKIGEWYCAIYKKFFERGRSGVICDTLLIDAASDTDFKLFVEIVSAEKELLFRGSVPMKRGANSLRLKVTPSAMKKGKYARIYPEDNAEPTLAVRNLAFVKDDAADVPAKKVKCVVWDLDNTLWDGILSENEPDDIKLKEGVAPLLAELDRRGVLNSIASKNDHGPVLERLEKLGVADYFLVPQINWGAKSDSIETIARRLNIGVDSLAFVDDSAFEREEVKSRFPCVRVYDENVVSKMADLPEFDVTVTADSSSRRKMYLTELKRSEDFEAGKTDIASFIKSCELTVKLKRPTTDAEAERCFELANRTNQLNLSGRKYTSDEFRSLILEEGTETLYGTAFDKYGSYGGVLFAKYRAEGDVIRVYEFAMSCRIAAKFAENAVIAYLLGKAENVIFEGNRTAKNRALTDGLEGAGMADLSSDGKILYRVSRADGVKGADIVSVVFEEDPSDE